MSNEKEQDVKKETEEQVDYQSLFNSLVKENEQKEEPKEELAEKKALRKKRVQQTRKTTVSKTRREQNKRVTSHDLHNHQSQRTKQTAPAVAKKGRFYQSLCPYCGKKVGLFHTWMLKNKGDYFCPDCGNHSAVVIDKVIVPMAVASIIISVILVLIFTFLIDMHIWSIILIFIPFLIFFCASVFLVRLKRIAPPGAKRKKKPVQDDLQHTRVI